MKKLILTVLLLSICGGMWLRAAEENINDADVVQTANDSTNSDSVLAEAERVFRGAMNMCLYYFAQYESFRLWAYDDGKGNMTIGVGNTKHPDGRPIRRGDHITKEQAVAYFEDYQLKKSWPEIGRLLHVSKMTASDFVAVSCIMWNCGSGVLSQNGTELAKALNAFFDNRKSVTARNAVQALFAKRVYARNRKTGKLEYMKGLDRRRNLEMMVLLGEVRIGMEPNTSNDSCYICLTEIKEGVFNSVPMDFAKSYDANSGIYTSAPDSVNFINNYSYGITFGERLAKAESQPAPQPRSPQTKKRTVRR